MCVECHGLFLRTPGLISVRQKGGLPGPPPRVTVRCLIVFLWVQKRLMSFWIINLPPRSLHTARSGRKRGDRLSSRLRADLAAALAQHLTHAELARVQEEARRTAASS